MNTKTELPVHGSLEIQSEVAERKEYISHLPLPEKMQKRRRVTVDRSTIPSSSHFSEYEVLDGNGEVITTTRLNPLQLYNNRKSGQTILSMLFELQAKKAGKFCNKDFVCLSCGTRFKNKQSLASHISKARQGVLGNCRIGKRSRHGRLPFQFERAPHSAASLEAPASNVSPPIKSNPYHHNNLKIKSFDPVSCDDCGCLLQNPAFLRKHRWKVNRGILSTHHNPDHIDDEKATDLAVSKGAQFDVRSLVPEVPLSDARCPANHKCSSNCSATTTRPAQRRSMNKLVTPSPSPVSKLGSAYNSAFKSPSSSKSTRTSSHHKWLKWDSEKLEQEEWVANCSTCNQLGRFVLRVYAGYRRPKQHNMRTPAGVDTGKSKKGTYCGYFTENPRPYDPMGIDEGKPVPYGLRRT